MVKGKNWTLLENDLYGLFQISKLRRDKMQLKGVYLSSHYGGSLRNQLRYGYLWRLIRGIPPSVSQEIKNSWQREAEGDYPALPDLGLSAWPYAIN